MNHPRAFVSAWSASCARVLAVLLLLPGCARKSVAKVSVRDGIERGSAAPDASNPLAKRKPIPLKGDLKILGVGAMLQCPDVTGADGKSLSGLTYEWLAAPDSTGPFERLAGENRVRLRLTAKVAHAHVACRVLAADGTVLAQSDALKVEDAPPVAKTAAFTSSALPGGIVTLELRAGREYADVDDDVATSVALLDWPTGFTPPVFTCNEDGTCTARWTLPEGTGKNLVVRYVVTTKGNVKSAPQALTVALPNGTDAANEESPPPPAPASVSLAPLSADATSTLTCTPLAPPDTPAGISPVFTWYVGLTLLTGQTSSTVSGVVSRGDAVSCRVAYGLNGTLGEATTSNVVTVGNASPSAPVVSLTSADPTKLGSFTCSPSLGADPDGDTLTPTYRWRSNGVVIAGETTTTLSGAHGNVVVGEALTCEVDVADGQGATVTGTSAPLVVQAITPLDVSCTNATQAVAFGRSPTLAITCGSTGGAVAGTTTYAVTSTTCASISIGNTSGAVTFVGLADACTATVTGTRGALTDTASLTFTVAPGFSHAQAGRSDFPALPPVAAWDVFRASSMGSAKMIATHAGIAVEQPDGTYRTLTRAQGLGSQKINSLAETANGVLLAATHSGLSRSTNGGASWTNLTTNTFTTDLGDPYIFYSLLKRVLVDGPLAFLLSDNGVAFSDDDGVSLGAAGPDGVSFGFGTDSTGITTNSLNDILSLSSTELLMAGGDAVYRSTNGGTTWTKATGTSGSAYSRVFAYGGAIYALREGSSIALARSTDGGATFTTGNQLLSEGGAVAARDGTHMVVGGRFGLRVSTAASPANSADFGATLNDDDFGFYGLGLDTNVNVLEDFEGTFHAFASRGIVTSTSGATWSTSYPTSSGKTYLRPTTGYLTLVWDAVSGKPWVLSEVGFSRLSSDLLFDERYVPESFMRGSFSVHDDHLRALRVDSYVYAPSNTNNTNGVGLNSLFGASASNVDHILVWPGASRAQDKVLVNSSNRGAALHTAGGDSATGWTVYNKTTTPSLLSNNVTAMAMDSLGRAFLATSHDTDATARGLFRTGAGLDFASGTASWSAATVCGVDANVTQVAVASRGALGATSVLVVRCGPDWAQKFSYSTDDGATWTQVTLAGAEGELDRIRVRVVGSDVHLWLLMEEGLHVYKLNGTTFGAGAFTPFGTGHLSMFGAHFNLFSDLIVTDDKVFLTEWDSGVFGSSRWDGP